MKNLNLLWFLLISATLVCGCSEETKLSKEEVANFKGSANMSDEARKHMEEGMKWQAEYNQKLAEKNQARGSGN